jgi:GTP diphosphokinase / guanosine-3',5'-bis(diphosphate) 3'-diphosphatase
MSSPGRSGTLGRRALQAIEGSPMERAREAVPGGIAKVLAAAEFAAFKHREQRRKGVRGSPYINHPLAVASTLATEAGVEDVDVLAAAILHDTIEDTDTTEAELERAFGPEVASIVVEVTDEKTQSKALRKRMQIAHAPHLSAQAKLVKLADKIVNLRDIVARPNSRSSSASVVSVSSMVSCRIAAARTSGSSMPPSCASVLATASGWLM